MSKRVVSDEVVYTGAICRVHKIGLRGDDGQVTPRDLVEYADATVIVPVLPDGAFVLIANQRFAVGEELLEFPAGKLEQGEEPPVCAARELTEETGYTAGKLVRLGGFYTCPGSATEFIHAFAAGDMKHGKATPEGYEQIKVRIVQPRRLRQMIYSGELHDAKSIAAYTLWLMREAK